MVLSIFLCESWRLYNRSGNAAVSLPPPLDHHRGDRFDGGRWRGHVEAEVISFERFTEKREAQIWERVDKQEVEITDLKTRVSVIEALMKAKDR